MKKTKRTLRNIRPGLNEILTSKFGLLSGFRNKTQKLGFTLVELIIVIAIIAVLAVAAFMMLTKWLGKSRDSRRLGDLGTISRGLQVGYSDTDDGVNMYPTVKDQTGAISILSGGEVLGYQGVVDNDVVFGASMQKAPKDPSDGSFYTYLVTQNRQKFQLLAFLEDGTEVGFLNDAYALEYANMTPTTKGFELGVLLRASDNMPANLIGGTLTGVEMSMTTAYNAIVSDDNIKKGADIINAPIVKEEIVAEPVDNGPTPQEACEAKDLHTWDGSNCNYDYRSSCDALYQDNNTLTSGKYTVDVDGAGGVDPFEVYCEMGKEGAGWMLLARWTNYSGDEPIKIDEIGVNGTNRTFTNDATNYPVVPNLTDLSITEVLYINNNPSWTSTYGDLVWNADAHVPPADSRTMVTYQAVSSVAGIRGFAMLGAAWIPYYPTYTRGTYNNFGVFDVANNTGPCGGANVVGSNKRCSALYAIGTNNHFDITNQKYVYVR